MTVELDRNRLRNFTWALSAAIYDKRLEISGIRLVHAFDTQVIFGALNAPQELCEPRVRNDQNERLANMLARALWMAGYGPKAIMLGPHLAEFHSLLENIEPESIDGPRLTKLLETHTHPQVVKALGTIHDCSSDIDRVRDILVNDVLPNLTYHFFVALEAYVHAGADQRRAILAKRLDLHSSVADYSLSDLIEDKRFVRWASAISSLRRPKKSGLPERNDVADAAALVCIARSIEATSDVQLRFWTNTAPVISFVNAQDVREHLSYRDDSLIESLGAKYSVSWRERSVARQGLYYVLRSLVPDLGHGEAKSDLSKLEELLGALRRHLAIGGDLVSLELAPHLQSETRGLLHAIDRFSSNEFIRRVWITRDNRLINKLVELVVEWRPFREATTSNLEWLEEQLSVQQSEMVYEAVRSMERSARSFRRLVGSLAKFSEVNEPVDRLINQGRSLDRLFVAFGADGLASDIEGIAAGYLDAASGLSRVERAQYATELLNSVSSRGVDRSIEVGVGLAAFLWTVGMYHEASAVLLELGPQDNEHALALQLFEGACSSASRHVSNQHRLEQLKTWATRVDQVLQRPVCLGLAAMFSVTAITNQRLNRSNHNVNQMLNRFAQVGTRWCREYAHWSGFGTAQEFVGNSMGLVIATHYPTGEASQFFEESTRDWGYAASWYIVLDAVLWAEFEWLTRAATRSDAHIRKQVHRSQDILLEAKPPVAESYQEMHLKRIGSYLETGR